MESLNIAVVGLGRMVSYTAVLFRTRKPHVADFFLRVNATSIPCSTVSLVLVL